MVCMVNEERKVPLEAYRAFENGHPACNGQELLYSVLEI